MKNIKHLFTIIFSMIVFLINAQGPTNVWQWGGNTISSANYTSASIGTKNNKPVFQIVNNIQRAKWDTAARSAIRFNGRVSQIGLGNSTYFGFNCGVSDNGAGSYSNTANGDNALASCVSGIVNTAIGSDCLRNCTGSSNTGGGYACLMSAVGSGNNTGWGESCLRFGITMFGNCGFGKACMPNVTMDNNCGFGLRCLEAATTVSNSTGVGAFTAQNNVTGSGGIYMGYAAGKYITSLHNRLFINSIDRSTLANDSTLSIIYGYQSTTTANQRLYWNAKTFFAEDAKFAANKSVFCDFYTDRTGTFSLIYRGTTRTNVGVLGTTIIADNGQLSCGTTNTAVASAQVEIVSTTKGFLPPRMTATQGSAISSPAEGLIIYATDTNGTFTAKGWWGYDGAAWQKLNN